MCGICSCAAVEHSDFRQPRTFQTFPTAVADALLSIPILKHTFGAFGLFSASKKSMVHHLGTLKKSCVLYPGGMAELFLCSKTEETLYLRKRAGFIKLALQTGADVVPLYFFGNTTCLDILKHPVLAWMSRKAQLSCTLLWGRFFLPIPYRVTMVYARGMPLGLPVIKDPTKEDVAFWHEKFIQETERLFDTYKVYSPQYAEKKLVIL